MNTNPISAAVSSNPAGADQARKRDGSAADDGFSTVLGEQQSALSPTAAPAAAVNREGAGEGKQDRGTDAALAENAAEQGLAVGAPTTHSAADSATEADSISARTLPQIALQLAADIAEIQRGVRGGDQDPDAGRVLAKGGSDDASIAQGDKAARDSRDAATAAALRFASDPRAGQLGSRAGELRNRTVTDASAAATDSADARRTSPQQHLGADGSLGSSVALGTQAAAHLLTERQTSLGGATNAVGPGKAASIAGAKQAVLAMQARMQAAETAQPPSWQSAGGTVFNFNDPLARAFADLPAYLGMQQDATPVEGQAALFATSMNAAPSTSLGSLNLFAHSHAAVSTPMNNPQWGADFSRQFVTLTQNGQTGNHIAELRLDPPELGPLRISINISDNVAHALFVSPHASVRQSVESAMAQLQQALADAGISLGQANVSDEGQNAEQTFNESLRSNATRGNGASTGDGDSAVESAAATATRRAPAADALIDTFA